MWGYSWRNGFLGRLWLQQQQDGMPTERELSPDKLPWSDSEFHFRVAVIWSKYHFAGKRSMQGMTLAANLMHTSVSNPFFFVKQGHIMFNSNGSRISNIVTIRQNRMTGRWNNRHNHWCQLFCLLTWLRARGPGFSRGLLLVVLSYRDMTCVLCMIVEILKTMHCTCTACLMLIVEQICCHLFFL